MVLASKPKTRESVHQRRRTGSHHPQTKHYTKTYWPYLPLLGLTVFFNILMERSNALGTIGTTTRMQAWLHASTAETLVVLGIVVVAGIIFTTRHIVAWQKVITKGESFASHHKSIDLFLAVVVLVGVLLTRIA